ncbi:MAG: HAMP domain-containing sensor histidine kinase [Candidatus Falkowbacteria bacterium]|nr:HAMP domain-containing sensor histidine kinase [Candidatus Falkowbacteria bacterium]
MNLTKFLALKLSDKILLIFFIFSTLALFLVAVILGGSWQQLLIIISITYAFAFIFTFVISRNFSRSLIELAFKVQEMAAGNFSKSFVTNRKDEVGQLINSLNELISRLQTGVAIDVSKQKEIYRAKTDFVSLAAHQLRTPLSIVKWYADYLISGDAGGFNPEQVKYIQEIFHSNQRLIDLVNALLDASRIDMGTFIIEPEPTDIIERAETALTKFYPEITKKKILLEKHYDKFGLLKLDPRLTQIIFENIIANAVQYTPPGGKIRLIVKKTEKDIYIKISDTGCGIPRAQQIKVCTKLFRADNAKKMRSDGSGLGLYIVKAIVEKSGGKIWFESPSLELLLEEKQDASDLPLDKRNLGTTFFITIPLQGMKPKAGTKKLENLK